MSHADGLIVGHSQLLSHLSAKRYFYALAQVDMSSTCRVPFVGLDVLPGRTMLQVEFSPAVKYMQMHHRVQYFASIMSMSSTDGTEDVSLFVDDGKLLFLVVVMLIDYFRFCHN